MSTKTPESLSDLLVDISDDLSIMTAENALLAAADAADLDDLDTNLEEAEDALKELLKLVKARRRRVKKAQAAVEGDTVREDDEDEE